MFDSNVEDKQTLYVLVAFNLIKCWALTIVIPDTVDYYATRLQLATPTNPSATFNRIWMKNETLTRYGQASYQKLMSVPYSVWL